jgi:hypothetical protein
VGKPAKRVLEQEAPGVGGVADPREPGRRQYRLEPAVEELPRQTESWLGTTTTYRFGSVPSLEVVTPGKSFSRR